jgi:F-type H+-transporting ATPase subunit gamma
MANLKEIRNRITSVSSTMQITSAMKMVSAAKLKKAQDAITAMRLMPKIDRVITKPFCYAWWWAVSSLLNEIKKSLVVSITSNRGLGL